MRRGILKFFYVKGGYGFIEDSDTKEQFFITHKSLPNGFRHRRLEENLPVTFEVSTDEKDIPEEGSGKLPLAVNVNFIA